MGMMKNLDLDGLYDHLMEEVSRVEREHQDANVMRTIINYRSGVKKECMDFHGESWTVYTIIPREIINHLIATYRSEHQSMPDFWNVMYRFVRPEYYGGPGRAFWNEANYKCANRRYVVLVQSGGLDV